MKQFLFLTFLLAASVAGFGQTIVAVTVTGDTVLLADDGTWSFKNKYSSTSLVAEIPTNKTVFKKPSSSTKMVEGGKGIYEVWYNPSTWTKVSNKQNKDAEISLEMNNKLAFAMVIYEKTEIPLEALLDIALENGQSTAPNMKVVMKEYRVVNGTEVALMQMEGEIEKLKFTYYSYYYSNPNGTWQFHTYTMTSFFKQYQKKLEDLLNGFIVK